jgi:hypothetical protein
VRTDKRVADVDLSFLTGNTGRKGKGKGKSGKFDLSAVQDTVTSADYADLGAGGDATKRALARILKDPAIDQQSKDQAQQIADGAKDAGKKKGLFESLPGIGPLVQKVEGIPVVGDVIAGTSKAAAFPIEEALMALDKPKRAIWSGAAAVTNAIDGHHGDKGVLDQLVNDVFTRPSYNWNDVRQEIGLKPRTGLAGGLTNLALDIGLDPTTYVGGGAKRLAGDAATAAKAAAEVGQGVDVAKLVQKGKSVSNTELARLAQQAGFDAAKVGDIAAKGASVLHDAELAKLGVRAGLTMSLPFTGRAATLVAHDTLLPGLEKLAQVKQAVKLTGLGQKVLSNIGKTGQLRADIAKGGEVAAHALAARDAMQTSQLFGKKVLADNAARLTQVQSAAKEAGLSGADVTRLVEATDLTHPAVAALLAKPGAAAVRDSARQLFADMHAGYGSFKDGAAMGALGKVENYVPHMRPEVQDAIKKVIEGKNPGWTKTRGLVESSEFMGHSLADPSWGATLTDRINNIAQTYGVTAKDVKFFNDDFFDSAGRYIKGYSYRMADRALVQSLIDKGAAAVLKDVPHPVAKFAEKYVAQQGFAKQLTDKVNELNATLRTTSAERTSILDTAAEMQAAVTGDLEAQARGVLSAREVVAAHAGSAAEKVAAKVKGRHAAAQSAVTQVANAIGPAVSDTGTYVANLGVEARGFRDAAVSLGEGEFSAQLHDVAHRLDDIASRLGSAGTDAERSALGLEAEAARTEGRLAQVGDRLHTVDEWLALQSPEKVAAALQGAVKDGYTKLKDLLGMDFVQAPDSVVAALAKAGETAAAPGKFLEAWDKMLALQKREQLVSVRFPVNNLLGGFFNNFVSGVDTGSYVRFQRAKAALDKGREALAKLPAEDRRAIQQMADRGALFMETRISSEVLDGGFDQQMFKNRLLRLAAGEAGGAKNPIVWSGHASERVEQLLRGTSMFDGLVRGQSFEGALQRVYDFHYNYADLSKLERGVARRVIPFWTFTSRNMPLQLEMLLKNPAPYKAYQDAADSINNTNQGSLPSIVPAYLKDSGAIHLGGGMFMTPEQPQVLAEQQFENLTNPVKFATNAAVPIKLAVESFAGKQLYKDLPLSDRLTELPKVWGGPVAKVLSPLFTHDAEGNPMITQRLAYQIEQMVPLLGRFRRLAPSESKYQDRMLASWATFLGVGLAQVTDQNLSSVGFARAEKLKALYQSLQDRGLTYPKKDPNTVDPQQELAQMLRSTKPKRGRASNPARAVIELRKQLGLPAKAGKKVPKTPMGVFPKAAITNSGRAPSALAL